MFDNLSVLSPIDKVKSDTRNRCGAKRLDRFGGMIEIGDDIDLGTLCSI